MRLLPDDTHDNLKGWSFVDEFTSHDRQYLEPARRIAQIHTSILEQEGIRVPTSKEEYAEVHLVRLVTAELLSKDFPYFREALKRGKRQYIDPVDYWAFASSMARYILYEAIKRGILL